MPPVSIVISITTNNSLSPKIKWFGTSKICLKFNGSCLKQDTATFTPANVVNSFIVYELDILSQDLNPDFTQKDCLIGAVELTKTAHPDKYSYYRYGIGFDSCSLFLLLNFDWDKKAVILGVDNSSSVHIANKKKDISVLGEGLTKRLDNPMITAKAE